MLVVKKFGGTSVGNKERIMNVAKRCIEDYKKGNDVVVVLSAMGKMTDELIAKAKEINPSDVEAFLLGIYTFLSVKPLNPEKWLHLSFLAILASPDSPIDSGELKLSNVLNTLYMFIIISPSDYR